jgi:hypothetical protein
MANKGYGFEVEILKYFQDLEDGIDKKSYRVYGSGRNKLAKNLDPDSQLDGDVRVKLDFLDKNINVECKHYKTNRVKKSFPLLKEWLDQNREESEKEGNYSIVAIKYKFSKENNIQYVIPREHFEDLLKFIKNNKPKTSLSDYSIIEILDELTKRIKEKEQ